MCAVFGLIDYEHRLSTKAKEKILKVLSRECEVRGKDATGYAFNKSDKLTVFKRPLPAHKLKLRLPDNVNVIMGHTRMATQGNQLINHNNHPFLGNAGLQQFALAHNGVISNDYLLHRNKEIPDTNIETDSYAAVQLIEKEKHLSFRYHISVYIIKHALFRYKKHTSAAECWDCSTMNEAIRLCGACSEHNAYFCNRQNITKLIKHYLYLLFEFY